MSNSKKQNGSADFFSDRSAQPLRWPATIAYPRIELVRAELSLCQRAFFEDRSGPLAKATSHELCTAARFLFLAGQAELAVRGEGFQPQYQPERSALYEIWKVLHLAKRAGATDPEDKTVPRAGRAKQLQLEASKGQPLAVCIGRPWRKRPSLPDSATNPGRIVFISRGDGCGIIFRDSVSLKRPWFHSYCPDCRKRKLDRELKGRLEAGLWGRQSVPLPDGSRYFIGKCSVCEDVFKTLDVRQLRCQKHHKNRRSLPPGFLRTSAE